MILLFFFLLLSTAHADQFDLTRMENECRELVVGQRVIGYDKDGVDFLGRRVCPNDWQPGMPFAGCKAGDTIVAYYGQAFDGAGFDGDGNLGRTAQFRITLREDATPTARAGSGCIDTSAYGEGNPEPGLCVGPDKVVSFAEVIGTPEVEGDMAAGIYVFKGKLYVLFRDGTKYKVALQRVRK